MKTALDYCVPRKDDFKRYLREPIRPCDWDTGYGGREREAANFQDSGLSNRMDDGAIY